MFLLSNSLVIDLLPLVEYLFDQGQKPFRHWSKTFSPLVEKVRSGSNSSVSVIYYQIKEPEKVIRLLSQKLAISEKEVRKKVEKISSREKIKSNVPKAIADEIREAGLSGIAAVDKANPLRCFFHVTVQQVGNIEIGRAHV